MVIIVIGTSEFQEGMYMKGQMDTPNGKIFIDNDNIIAGFLIYTIAGSEGSYGGLISLTDDIRIIKLIPNISHYFSPLPFLNLIVYNFFNQINLRQF